VRLYLVPDHVFRYTLPCNNTELEPLVHLPYWRVRGMAFTVREQHIEGRVVDTSRTALRAAFLPRSLGLRPQALALRPVGLGARGDFVRPHLELRDMVRQMGLPENACPNRRPQPSAPWSQFFIGETLSLIYAPYVRRNTGLYDPLGQCCVELPEAIDNPDLFALAQPADWSLRFIPVLCPACGWDLSGDNQSCVLICRQCATAWEAQGTGFSRVSWGLMPDSGPHDMAVPFWRIRADILGLRLESSADLRSLANLPARCHAAAGDAALFWVPAFKIQPRLFLRLSRQLTMRQPRGELVTELGELPLHPVTLPASEAAEAIALTLAAIAADKGQVCGVLPELRIAPREAALVYVPLSRQGSELVQRRLALGISRAALQLSAKI